MDKCSIQHPPAWMEHPDNDTHSSNASLSHGALTSIQTNSSSHWRGPAHLRELSQLEQSLPLIRLRVSTLAEPEVVNDGFGRRMLPGQLLYLIDVKQQALEGHVRNRDAKLTCTSI